MGRLLAIAVPSFAAATALWAAAEYAGGETCTDWAAGETFVSRYCVSSYSVVQGSQFGPEHLLANIRCCGEGAEPLPWVVDGARAALGEWVRIEFRIPFAIDALYIVNGYASPSDQRLFRQFNRVREMLLETSDGGRSRLVLRDTAVRQRIRWGRPQPTHWIKLSIVSTYGGGDGSRTALSAVYPDSAPAP